MTEPLLYLPFNGSVAGQDRSGVVTPTIDGTFAYASGSTGAAEQAGNFAAGYVHVPPEGHISADRGTVAIRFHDTVAAATHYLLRIGSATAGAVVRGMWLYAPDNV